MWLSLVERSVRDREVVGSNPAIPTIRTLTAGRNSGLPFGYRGSVVIQSFLQWLGFGLCHQLPERSFFGGGTQVPVCARDTGIYLGFMLSLILIALVHRGDRPREFPAPAGWVAIALMIGAMGVDGVSSYAGLRPTTNDLRLITGLLAGYAIGAVLTPMLNDEFWRTGSRERVLDPTWRLLAWLATVPVAFVAIRFGAPLLGVGYPAHRRGDHHRYADLGQSRHGVPDATLRAQGGSHHRRVAGDSARGRDVVPRDMALRSAPALARIGGIAPVLGGAPVRVRPPRYHAFEHTFEGGHRWKTVVKRRSVGTLDRLVSQALARDISPAVAEEARRATARLLKRAETHLLAAAEQRRAKAYFSAVVRRHAVRRGQPARGAARFVVAAVVEDLRASGRDGEAIWDQLQQGVERFGPR